MTHISAARRDSQIHDREAALAATGDLMEAFVAAYALMSHADGEVAAAERRRIFAILRENPAMSVFSRDDLAEEIALHEANFRYDPELAQQISRERLTPLAGNRRAAARVLAACRELIAADGVAHPSEYRALNEIKGILAFEDDAPFSIAPSIAAAQR